MTQEQYDSIVGKIMDIFVKENCTVNESKRLLMGVSRSVESSPVQKVEK